MELENIILSEVIQVQKVKSLIFFSHMQNINLIQTTAILQKIGHAKGSHIVEGKVRRRKLRR
jgi:hypothetical protein